MGPFMKSPALASCAVMSFLFALVWACAGTAGSNSSSVSTSGASASAGTTASTTSGGASSSGGANACGANDGVACGCASRRAVVEQRWRYGIVIVMVRVIHIHVVIHMGRQCHQFRRLVVIVRRSVGRLVNDTR